MTETSAATGYESEVGNPDLSIVNQVERAFASARFPEAVAVSSRSLAVYPGYGFYWKALGSARLALGDAPGSIPALQRATLLDVSDARSRVNLAVASLELGQLTRAGVVLNETIVLRANDADGFFYLGITSTRAGDLEKACVALQRSLYIEPKSRDTAVSLGNALQRRGLISAALDVYDRCICQHPEYAEVYSNRGVAIQAMYPNDLTRLRYAIYDFRRAIAVEPVHLSAVSNLGAALRECTGESLAIDESEVFLGRALSLSPSFSEALNNLACTVRDRRGPLSALPISRRAIRVNPKSAIALTSHGTILAELGRVSEAIAAYQKALALPGEFEKTRVYLAHAQLLAGDYSSGWKTYEARIGDHPHFPPGSRLPPIDSRVGSLSAGRSVVLIAEQGYGDTLQFCRYVKLVRDLGAKVILTLPRALTRLLASQGWGCEIMSLEEARGVHDYHCPMLSLPMVFGTTLETIPSSEEAYLHASSVDVERWRERLGVRDRLRVGVVWNGGFRPDQPELWAVNARRNVPLELFSRHLDIEGVDFFSLQKGDPAESEIRGREGEYWRRSRLYNYATELNDFADTAGLIANLDLVISVDTSTAHLAAAMGKPTWILNRYDTCWRWLLDRDDSPWYASVKLYRQHQDRDWNSTLALVADDLRRTREKFKDG